MVTARIHRLNLMGKSRLPISSPFIENSPLWKRAPARDENGIPYNDFMMLIPGLNKLGGPVIDEYLVKIQRCLKPFESVVVYIDMNIKLNILWISLKSDPGITSDIVLAIQQVIPHAKLVASDFNPNPQNSRSSIQKIKLWALSLKESLQKGALLRIEKKRGPK